MVGVLVFGMDPLSQGLSVPQTLSLDSSLSASSIASSAETELALAAYGDVVVGNPQGSDTRSSGLDTSVLQVNGALQIAPRREPPQSAEGAAYTRFYAGRDTPGSGGAT